MRWSVVAALAAAAVMNPDAGSAESKAGKDLYIRYCASCHGVDAKGGTALSKLMSIPTPDLTRIAARRNGWFPEVVVREIVDGRYAAHGPREMPVWGTLLTQDELIAITEHLYSLQEDGPK
jgi:mono/diheme cytochrome c family protein